MTTGLNLVEWFLENWFTWPLQFGKGKSNWRKVIVLSFTLLWWIIAILLTPPILPILMIVEITIIDIWEQMR